MLFANGDDTLEEDAQRRISEVADALEAAQALGSDPTKAHAELLAIHEAVMNPMAVQRNETDTFTLSMVKEFILRATKGAINE